MAEKNSILRLVQPIAKQEEAGTDSGAATPERATPDAQTMVSVIKLHRASASKFGPVPSSEVTEQRLVNKYQQDLTQRGGELGVGSQNEQHPILKDYLRGIDDNVNPSLDKMTPEEREKHENEKQYRNQLRLQRVHNLTSTPSPTLTR